MAYDSSKIEVRKSQIAEKGVFVKEKIEKDELIFDFSGSKGRTYTLEERKHTRTMARL